MTNNGNFTGKRQKFLECLLQESTIKGAASCAGIGERTAHRWIRDADFQAMLAQLESESLECISRGLLKLSQDTLGVLESALAEGETKDKLKAAEIVLSKLLAIRELASIENQLARLEGGIIINEGEYQTAI